MVGLLVRWSALNRQKLSNGALNILRGNGYQTMDGVSRLKCTTEARRKREGKRRWTSGTMERNKSAEIVE